jgi:hypothetical protein
MPDARMMAAEALLLAGDEGAEFLRCNAESVAHVFIANIFIANIFMANSPGGTMLCSGLPGKMGRAGPGAVALAPYVVITILPK